VGPLIWRNWIPNSHEFLLNSMAHKSLSAGAQEVARSISDISLKSNIDLDEGDCWETTAAFVRP
jgi:hypothetical protein